MPVWAKCQNALGHVPIRDVGDAAKQLPTLLLLVAQQLVNQLLLYLRCGVHLGRQLSKLSDQVLPPTAFARELQFTWDIYPFRFSLV